MDLRKKVSLVVGRQNVDRAAYQFDEISAKHRLIVHTFHNQDLRSFRNLTCEVVLYDEIKEMPGYIRGIEDRLTDSDLVIGFEPSSLSSFQACRAADRLGIPFGVYSSEWQSQLYTNAPNIRAIQFDICRNSSFFIVNDLFSHQYLQSLGIPGDKIFFQPFRVDRQTFKSSQAARNRFRKYVGIGNLETVILLEDWFATESNCEVVLDAFKILLDSSTATGEMRLIVHGNGPVGESLRYGCMERGIAKNVMFLAQDSTDFLNDLYNSADFSINPAHSPSQHLDPPPFRLLEQAVTGLIPIFSKGSISASVVQGLGIEVPNSTPREFASAVINCLAYPDRTENLKALLRSDSKESIRSTLVGKLVARVLEAENGRVNRNSSHAAAIQRIDEIVARGEIFDAYLEVERLLLLDIQSPQIKSAALRIKGDCLSAQDNFEGALDAYQQSLHEDSNNYKALKGLGFIAWHSHSNEEAITFFRKAHALHSEDSQVMLGLGLVYKRVGLLEQAIFWFEKSVGLDAQATAALAALTQACNEHPKPTFAIEALRRTIDTIGERPSLLMTLGNILVKNGQVAEGRMLLARALDRNSA